MAHPGNRISLRTTQRAPRSCLSCASRKVKCDKSVPCSRCIKRGQAEACVREMVIIRGEVTTWQDAPHVLTYEELSRENQQLRREIGALKAERDHGQPGQAMPASPGRRKRNLDRDDEGLEDELWQSLSSASIDPSSGIFAWDDVILPGPACSDKLIAYDMAWNSWVHYALEYPRFKDECDTFMESIQKGQSLDEADPAWMAVYFSALSTALLMMDDDEARSLPIPEGFTHQQVSRNWYDAAIFCLHRADFMRIPNIRIIQAIAILGMSFNNRGDSELGQHLWSSALRIAQRIGLNTPCSQIAEPCLSAEGQHRLWWTLVICEWLNLPYQPPRVDEVDFDVPLPSEAWPDNQADGIHPVHYHIFMARTATVVYNFRETIRPGLASLDEVARVVKTADEELAEIIDTLPAHLQPDTASNDEMRRLELEQPWIKWQRYDLTLVLLHLRIRINRTLQEQWLSCPGQYSWARTVSVSSAMSVIWINRNWDQPASMRKQWALSYHIFASAILLLRECQNDPGTDEEEYQEAIQAALGLLDGVKSHNAVAYHAARILRNKMHSRGLE